MKTSTLLSLIILIAFISCSNKKPSAIDEMYDQVMYIHDEIMPKMSDIMRYKKQLNEKLASLVAMGVEPDQNPRASIQKAIDDLDKAHEGMMDWMRNFDHGFKDLPEDDALSYLAEEKATIEDVGKLTNEALNIAEQILSK